MSIYINFILFILLMVSTPAHVCALTDPASSLKNQEIGFYTKLGTKVDTSIPFTNQDGEIVTLASLLQPGVPTVILPVYYGCPRICGFLFSGFVELIKSMKLVLGKEYRVIAVSFNPDDYAADAKERAKIVFSDLGTPEAVTANWSFLVGLDGNIRKLMDQLGFRYQKDGDEYAHGSGFIVLTPSGEISQYFTGIEFSPWDVRLSLIEASKGAIGSTIDHILLFCYKFDPTQGKYTLFAFNVLRGGVLAMIGLFVAAIFYFSRRVKQA